MRRAITLLAPAKVNLTLRVGPRRDDGFHDVQTVMQAIDLCDELTFTATRRPLVLTARALAGADPGVPLDRTNLIWRAADALWRFAGRAGDPHGVSIRLTKRIPVAAGLGGGSSDAATTLVGLERLWHLGIARADLVRIAATLGSDVAFFLSGGTAIGVGRGDEIFPLRELPRLGIVIIKPSFGVSTADAYRWLDDDRAADARPTAVPDRPIDVGWVSPLRTGNDLEPPVARRHPDIAEAVEALKRAGARIAAMSGSGSAVFGVFQGTIAPARVARLIRRPDWFIVPTRTLSAGESLRSLRVGSL